MSDCDGYVDALIAIAVEDGPRYIGDWHWDPVEAYARLDETDPGYAPAASYVIAARALGIL